MTSQPLYAGFWRDALLVALIAFGARGLMSWTSPMPESPEQSGGDIMVFLRVAQNISQNGCVSLSDPEGAICAPHWGGTQLPLFPGLLALTWWTTGNVQFWALRWVQTFLAPAAIVWLMLAVARWDARRCVAVATGVTLALSPLAVAWSRAILTESLAITISIWILAELIHSLAERRLRIGALAVALALAVWLRYDMIAATLPICVVALHLAPPQRAARHLVGVGLILTLTLGAWTLRCLDAGLPSHPSLLNERAQVYGLGEISRPIDGFAAWTRTWSLSGRDDSGSIDQASGPLMDYARIRIPDRAFEGSQDRQRVEILMSDLAKRVGQPMTMEMDREFHELARRRLRENPAYYLLWIPCLRVVGAVINIRESGWWPTFGGISVSEQMETLRSTNGFVGAFFTVLIRDPASVLGKSSAIVWRVLVFVVLVAGAATVVALRMTRLYALTLAVWVFTMARLAIPALLGVSRSRLMVEFVPWIEMMFVFLCTDLLSRRRRMKGCEVSGTSLETGGRAN